MLQLLRGRRRRDELTPLEAEIARERLPIPHHPVPVRRGGVFAVLRHKAIITVAVVASCGLLGGGVYAGSWWEERQEAAQLEERIDDARDWRNSRLAALGALHHAELEERGIFPLEEPGVLREIDVMEKHPPREPVTLRAQGRLEVADAELDALLVQQD